MLINKYKPEKLENIIGNTMCINSLQNWFENWYVSKSETKTDSKKVCVCALLSGSNGIGKTLTVDLLIKQYNLNPISLNPHEKADKEYIIKTIIPSIQVSKSFTNKQNVFVIHDIDCYDDYGFISSIVTCLKETKIPVIATCNNRYDQSLKPLTPYCLDVKFQKPNASDIVKFVKQIIKKESIVISDAKLNQLIEDTDCDIRSVFNNLQLQCGNIGIKNNENVLNTKDKTNTNIFDMTKQFMSQNVDLDDKQRLFWTNNDLLPLMIHENYPANNIKMKNEVSYLNNISESIHSLSDIDLFEKDIHMNGNWELLPYTAWFSIKSVTNCHSKTMIKFTSFFEKKASKKQTMVYGDITHLHVSKVEEKPKKKNSPKRNSSVKEPKTPRTPRKPKTPKTPKAKSKPDPKPKAEISEVLEKPKIVRRKKVNLIIEE
jgi:replication factor C subunit 1